MTHLNKIELETLEAWLDESRPLDSLYAEFSKTEQGVGAFGRDPVEAGKSLLRNLHETLSGPVCGSKKIKSLVQDPEGYSNDSIALGALIATQIENSPAQIVNRALAAALIVRIGVRVFCEKQWKS